MRSPLVLLFLALAIFTAYASAACEDSKTCAECAAARCEWCPATNVCTAPPSNTGDGTTPGSGTPGVFCPTFKITTKEGCDATQGGCGEKGCGPNAICNIFKVPASCSCTNCTLPDENKRCTIPMCDADTQTCSSTTNTCQCNRGLIAVPDGNKLVCKDLSCGTFLAGCGPNSKCVEKKCVCDEGFNPVTSQDPSVHLGCIQAPKTCAETCKIENAQCVNEVCVCKPGFALGIDGRSCKEVEVPVGTNCSAKANCKDCSTELGCLWCQGKDNKGSCVANVASTGTNACSVGQPVLSPQQCGCAAGCPGENEACTLMGCVCRDGFIYQNGKCVDAKNPCASRTCNEGEECKNEQLQNTTLAICRCKEGTVRIGDKCVEPSNPCPDTSICRCVTIPGLNSQVCCKPPFDVDIETASCRIKCPEDGSFVSDITKCPCKEGMVHDLGNELCVSPCPDGTTPNFGRCGTTCPEGQSFNPNYVPGSQDQPPCGFVCPDGKFVLYREKCFEGCETKPAFYCPCKEGLVHDLVTRACVPPCKETNLPPSNGVCPTKNFCPEGVPFPTADGKVVCMRKCPNGEWVQPSEKCPEAECPTGTVRDRATQACVQPCADGSTPFNNNCPVICTSLIDCCAALGDPTKCPKPECEEGKVRNSIGDCVTPCEDGTLPSLKDGSCTSTDCPKGLVKGGDGACGIYCNATYFTTFPNECCPEGQIFSPTNQKCHCRDGTLAVEGHCRDIVICTASTCPCPAPLKRDEKTGKCLCPDPVAFPDPFDGRRCGFSPCPPGLKAVNNECVCPLTGALPERREVNGREVTLCVCDPEKIENCPLTPQNCEGSTFSKCQCLTNPSLEACSTTFSVPSKDSCRANPSDPRCFCLLRPEARECATPNPCLLSPNDPSCLTGAECTMEKLLKEQCTREEFCKTRTDAPECACFRPGGCSQAGISFGNDVTFGDIKDAVCAEADYKNKDNKACYCKANYDPRTCFCFLFPADLKCQNPDGAGTVPTPEIAKDNACKIVNQIPGATAANNPCTREQTVKNEDDKVEVELREGNDVLVDEVKVEVEKEGNPGLLFLTRQASKGNNAPAGATVDDSNISVRLGFLVTRCFELLDLNNNNAVDDGETIVSEVLFKKLDWTVHQLTNDEGFITITFISADKNFKLTYVLSSSGTSLGGAASTKPPRNTKFSMEVNYPFQSSSSKLACEAKLITSVAITFKDSVLSLGAKAQVKFETEGVSGSTVVPITTSTPVETTASDAELAGEDDEKVFTLVFVAHTMAVPNFYYDPDIVTSEEAPQASNFESGGGTPTQQPDGEDSGAVLSPLFGLVVALVCLVAGFF